MDPAALDHYRSVLFDAEPCVELFAPSSYEAARELQRRMLELLADLFCFEAQHSPETVDALSQRLEADALGMLALLCSRPRRLCWPGIATSSRRSALPCPRLACTRSRRPPATGFFRAEKSDLRNAP